MVLIVADDGVGFHPEDKHNRSKGIGLIGIEERARLIGGAFEIESSPGEGTTLYVSVPYIRVQEVVIERSGAMLVTAHGPCPYRAGSILPNCSARL